MRVNGCRRAPGGRAAAVIGSWRTVTAGAGLLVAFAFFFFCRMMVVGCMYRSRVHAIIDASRDSEMVVLLQTGDTARPAGVAEQVFCRLGCQWVMLPRGFEYVD